MYDALTNLSISNSWKRSGWASDKCLARLDVLPPVVSSFTFIICFECKVMPYFTSTVLFICFGRINSLICLIHHVVRLLHLPVAQKFEHCHLQVNFGTAAYEIQNWAKLWYRTVWNIIDTGIFRVPVYCASLVDILFTISTLFSCRLAL